jgi:2,3-dihydroxybiphenyl 1,2-dioxygenase
MSTGLITQLGYVGMSAHDLPAWNGLLTRLGMQVEEGAMSGRKALLVRLDELSYRIAIAEGDADDVAFIGWEVPDRTVLEEAVAAAARRGVEFAPATRAELEERGVLAMYWAADPLGVRHEVYAGPTVDDRKTIDRNLLGRFRGGPIGFGHATVFASADAYAPALDFYQGGLGLVESGRRDCLPTEGTPITLLRCNERQHSLAVMVPSGTPGKKIAHVYAEYAELDFLGQAYDAALDLGVVTTTLGRHQADHAVSFYASTPSGTELELGWDSRLILAGARIEKFRAQRQPSIWGHRKAGA